MKRLYEEMERQIEEEKELVIRMVGDIKEESRWSHERLGTWDRVVSTIVCLCFRTQERMKESQLRNEMREEIAQKDLLLTQLQTRAKELQETLSRVQENETTSKHDVALLLKEKVQWIYRLYNIDRRKLFGYGHNYFLWCHFVLLL